jgi:hypothetical protein
MIALLVIFFLTTANAGPVGVGMVLCTAADGVVAGTLLRWCTQLTGAPAMCKGVLMAGLAPGVA